MKKNIHVIDRTARLVFAAIVAVLWFSGIISGTLATVLGIVAIIMAFTAAINFCPLYYVFGISTRKKSSEE